MERRLKGSEDFFEVLHRNFGFLLTAAVKIESEKGIDFEQLCRGFAHLANNHPILKAKISPDKDSASHKYLLTLVENFTPDVTESDTLSNDWQSRFEECLHQPLNTADGPLWRVKALKPVKEGPIYRQTMIIGWHHAIADGRALAGLCSELIQWIKGDSSLKGHALLPSLHERLGDRVKNNWVAKKLVSVVVNTFLLKMLRGSGENPLFSIFPRITELDQAKEARTKVLAFCLEESTTFRLLTLSKAYAVTVEGLVTAIAARAFRHFIDKYLKDGKPVVEAINFAFVLDMRHRVQGKSGENGMTCCGCYISRVPCSLKIQYADDSQSFWAAAQESTKELDRNIANEQDVENYKMMDLIGGKKEDVITGQVRGTPHGRLGSDLFVASYSGEHSKKEELGPRMKEFYLAAAEHQAGPVFANNVILVDGQLCWALTYFTHVSGKTVGEEIQKLILEEIKLASQ